MLATDHLPQLCVSPHARVRFLQRCRWDMRSRLGCEVDAEVARFVAGGWLFFGYASWKDEQERTRPPRWMVELAAWTRPRVDERSRRVQGWYDGPPVLRRVAFVLACRGECWHVVTVLTGPGPRLAFDVLPIAA